MGLVGRVKFEGPAPPKGRNIVSQKSPVGRVNMRAYNTFWFVDQSSQNFFRAIGDEMYLMKKF